MSGCTHCFAYDDTIIDEQQRVRTSHRCFFVLIILLHFFFFSSRRRHTRYWRDWSSDVCSSDLAAHMNLGNVLRELERHDEAVASLQTALRLSPNDGEAYSNLGLALKEQGKLDDARSEERRVGKECRTRW